MPHFYVLAITCEAPGKVNQATQIRPDQEIGFGQFGIGNFIVRHARRDFGVFDGEKPAKSAANFRVGNIDDIQAFDR